MSPEPYGPNHLMVTAAVRYCLGRQTYIVGVCADWLIRLWPELPQQCRAGIERDIEDEFKRDDQARALCNQPKPLGWDCDRREWERVRALWRPA